MIRAVGTRGWNWVFKSSQSAAWGTHRAGCWWSGHECPVCRYEPPINLSDHCLRSVKDKTSRVCLFVDAKDSFCRKVCYQYLCVLQTQALVMLLPLQMCDVSLFPLGSPPSASYLNRRHCPCPHELDTGTVFISISCCIYSFIHSTSRD